MAYALDDWHTPENGVEPRDQLDSWVQLADRMAEALRELRRHVPDREWWDGGAAAALHEFQACRPRPTAPTPALRL